MDTLYFLRLDTCCLLAVLVLLLPRSFIFYLQSAEASTLSYKWNIGYQFWSPDCVEKVVISINGQFPGPTISGRVGDSLEVEVQNSLPTESVAIHWHGIRQIGTPWADGTPSVSQCAINPGESFVYKFMLDKAGTYSYYSLHGLQRSAGLYGMLIVDLPVDEKEPFYYDGELSFLVTDWWHKSAQEQSLGLSLPPSQFRWVGEPQSLLIGGHGRYDCSTVPKGIPGSGDSVPCDPNNPQCSPYVMPVERGKTYRLRIASVASLSSLNFLIEKHSLLVVEADGNYVDPVEVEDLDMYAGETYSVLLTTNQFPGRNYWAVLNVRGRQPKTTTGVAILNYFPIPASRTPFTSPPTGPAWNDIAHSIAQSKSYKSRSGYELPIPQFAHKHILLLNTQNLVHGNIKWAINNISLTLPATPYLAAMTYELEDAFDPSPPPSSFSPDYNITVPPKNPNATMSSAVYELPSWRTIDVVLQNANTLFPKNSEIHPWHLHGHDFWIVGRGQGVFDPEKDPESYNLENPPLRNTATLFPYGWVALRFKADNPGVWLFHCNIEPHLMLGMGVVFAEGIDWVDDLPVSTMGCGVTRELMVSGLFADTQLQ